MWVLPLCRTLDSQNPSAQPPALTKPGSHGLASAVHLRLGAVVLSFRGTPQARPVLLALSVIPWYSPRWNSHVPQGPSPDSALLSSISRGAVDGGELLTHLRKQVAAGECCPASPREPGGQSLGPPWGGALSGVGSQPGFWYGGEASSLRQELPVLGVRPGSSVLRPQGQIYKLSLPVWWV